MSGASTRKIEVKYINLKVWTGKPQSLEKKNMEKVGQYFLVKVD